MTIESCNSHTAMADQYWHKGRPSSLTVRATLRFLQFVFAIIVAALYGVDLSHASHLNEHAQSSWIYAEVVACLSLITCTAHCLLTVRQSAWCTWDWVLCILWAAQTGVFGSMYISDHNSVDSGFTLSMQRMKVAVWIDLINMFLWVGTATYGVALCIINLRLKRIANKTELNPDAEEQMLHLTSKRQTVLDSPELGSETSLKEPSSKSEKEMASNGRVNRSGGVVGLACSKSEKDRDDEPPEYNP